MRNKIRVIVGLFLLAALGVVHAAQDGVTIFNEADEAKALTVRYRGNAAATITNTTTTVICSDGGTLTTITMEEADTMAELVADINAATNSSGDRNFSADYYCTLSTDVPSNKVIAASLLTISDGKQYSFLTMDTSAFKSFDVARTSADLANGIKSSSALTLTGITGVPGGTGDATISVYVDDDMKYQYSEENPVYSSSDGSIFNTNAIVALNLVLELYAGKERVHVRAARATTATTGGVGMVFTQR